MIRWWDKREEYASSIHKTSAKNSVQNSSKESIPKWKIIFNTDDLDIVTSKPYSVLHYAYTLV